jgi:hypothetical protein
VKRVFLLFLMVISILSGGENSLNENSFKKSVDLYNDYEEWHEYAGLTTLGLLGATILSSSDRGLHEGFGIATAVSMLATTGIGVVAHKDDIFDISEGLKKEHWHAILGAVATIAMVATVSKAPEDSHAALGMIGGLTAGVSFVIAKW